MKLKTFNIEINEHNIINYFHNPDDYEIVDLDIEINLNPIKDVITSLKLTEDENRKTKKRAPTDSILSPIIHKTFKDIPRNLMLDKKFLNYLSLVEFTDYVWSRWLDPAFPLPKNNDEKINYINNKDLTIARLIGNNLFKSNPSIHPIARLFWSAEILFDNDDYHLLKIAYSEQDFILQLFERKMNLHPPLAKSFTKLLEKKFFYSTNKKGEINYDRDKFRNEQKKLNFYGSTMNLEHIDFENLEELLKLNS